MSKESYIQLQLFATLKKFSPPTADSYAIQSGITVDALLTQLNVPEDQIKLVFVNGVRAELSTILDGGESVGIFPPVGGG